MKRLMRALALFFACASLCAQVPYDRLLDAGKDPANWLTYSGAYMSQRYTTLDRITPNNASDLEIKWVFQARSLDKFEATPLVVDGVVYVTQPPNDIVALDARTGRIFWTYEHDLPSGITACCGRVNRGLAILGDTLYMGTLDCRLMAFDAKTGKVLWDREVCDYASGYALAHAPLAVKDKIIIGTAGGELGIRGFLAAYDAKTGEQRWKFNTIPEPGEPGHETWENDAWKTGGASIWLTGSYDPELNLTYWGVGNVSPSYDGSVRPGDNLYGSSVLALDVDTGKLKWYFQFTPHDEWDWDAVQVPVLVNRKWKGRDRKLMLWGNRNAFFYVLDRETGEFLLGKPFVKQTWAAGLDSKGRPIRIPGAAPSAKGSLTFPGVQGGTNWFSPSYSPRTDLFYLSGWEDYSSVYFAYEQEYQKGLWYTRGSPKSEVSPTRRLEPDLRDEDTGYGVIRALDPDTGEPKWELKLHEVNEAGILTTATDVLFTGSREGHVMALDARDGRLLWRRYLGGQVVASPMAFAVDGKQRFAVACGHSLFVFGLRNE